MILKIIIYWCEKNNKCIMFFKVNMNICVYMIMYILMYGMCLCLCVYDCSDMNIYVDVYIYMGFVYI